MSSSWKSCTVKEIAADEPYSTAGGPFGSNLTSRDYIGKGVPVIRGKNMAAGKWIAGDFVFVAEEKANALLKNSARPGDIIFTQRGSPKGRRRENPVLQPGKRCNPCGKPAQGSSGKVYVLRPPGA